MIDVAGYRLASDRAYDAQTHVWVKQEPNGHVRIGLDPLGIETMGTLAQLALAEPGTTVARGEAAGTLEAEKFVGPLECPISGTVEAVNTDAIADPRRVHADPLATWLLEVRPTDYAREAAELVAGDDIAPWFAEKVADYRRKGVLAE